MLERGRSDALPTGLDDRPSVQDQALRTDRQELGHDPVTDSAAKIQIDDLAARPHRNRPSASHWYSYTSGSDEERENDRYAVH
jgi:hypothetical protein